MMKNKNRIDVHMHFVPDFYRNYLQENGIKEAGGYALPRWSVEEHLAVMDKNQIAKSILSISLPGVHLGDDAKARDMARTVNEFAAGIVAKYPERFGFFATLTLPDLEGALNELTYSFDHLKADGVVLMTNVGGRYIGDAAFSPLFEELNKRKAVVFIHPNELPGITALSGVPSATVDLLLDTVRAAISLVKSGTMRKQTELKIILSHAGGFLPFAASRLNCIACNNLITILILQEDIRRFYYDTAISASSTVFPSLLAFTDSKHILYGSDWPFVPSMGVDYFSNFLDCYPGLNNKQKQDINYLNATSFSAISFPARDKRQNFIYSAYRSIIQRLNKKHKEAD